MFKHFVRFTICTLVVSMVSVSSAGSVFAGEKEPPPLPLHGIEGYGGIAATYSAYLTNPAKSGEFFGKPSIGSGVVVMESGKVLGFSTITETLGDRLELGYSFQTLSLDDLPNDIEAATGIKISDDFVNLQNFNARMALVKEGDFSKSWMPAITLGIHYKYNDTVNTMDKELGGTLTSIGIEDNSGFDYTLYGSKMLTFMPRPVLINAGLRSTEAAHTGLLGFTGKRELLVEGNIVAFLTDRFALGAEYRQKPDSYTEIPGLIGQEDDWWSVVVAYVASDNLTVSGGYFNLGQVLNSEENNAFALKVKYEY